MGTDEHNVGSNPAMNLHPIQGELASPYGLFRDLLSNS